MYPITPASAHATMSSSVSLTPDATMRHAGRDVEGTPNRRRALWDRCIQQHDVGL
jgi:hypothetical protein